MKSRVFNYLIQNVFTRKFLCWNSFKSEWYWGKLEQSEKFGLGTSKIRATKLCETIEGSRLVLKNDIDGLVEEW